MRPAVALGAVASIALLCVGIVAGGRNLVDSDAPSIAVEEIDPAMLELPEPDATAPEGESTRLRSHLNPQANPRRAPLPATSVSSHVRRSANWARPSSCRSENQRTGTEPASIVRLATRPALSRQWAIRSPSLEPSQSAQTRHATSRACPGRAARGRGRPSVPSCAGGRSSARCRQALSPGRSPPSAASAQIIWANGWSRMAGRAPQPGGPYAELGEKRSPPPRASMARRR